MNIYINTAKQPPSVAADANGLQLTTSFEFKRGTTVALNVYLTGMTTADGIAKMTYGLKLRGKYDDALVVAAESTDAGTDTNQGLCFKLKATFDSAAIDAALKVNDVNTDDVISAAFVSEFAWENADGEIAASRTISTTLHNNVIRVGDENAAELPKANYAAAMLVKMKWADYCALTSKPEGVIYLVPDAPRVYMLLTEAAEMEARLAALIEELRGSIPAGQQASSTTAGVVKLFTDEVLSNSNATPVQVNANGQLLVRNANQGRYGAVIGSGKGVWIDNAGRIQLATRANHSGIGYAGNDMFIQAAARDVHPEAGTAAPVATDTQGWLVVLNATTSLPGGVQLATGIDDENPLAVLTAAQVKAAIAAANG